MLTVAIVGFVIVFAAMLAGVSVGFKYYERRRRAAVTGMLKTISTETVDRPVSVLIKPEGQGGSLLDQLLHKLNVTEKARVNLQQAGMAWTPAKLGSTVLIAAGVGFTLGLMIPLVGGRIGTALLLACAGGFVPIWIVRRARAKRLAQLEEQFPEALEFMARSMKAGHAFTISLEMLGQEMNDPIGQEFRTLFNEHNLGAPMEIALRNLTQRVPLLDVSFFSSAVLLQRQTGGNLAEILGRLSYVIHERFRLKGQVKASSSHGRMTATVLGALPALTCVALFFVAPGYLQGMLADDDGQKMIAFAVFGQILGNFVIGKIVNIKV